MRERVLHEDMMNIYKIKEYLERTSSPIINRVFYSDRTFMRCIYLSWSACVKVSIIFLKLQLTRNTMNGKDSLWIGGRDFRETCRQLPWASCPMIL